MPQAAANETNIKIAEVYLFNSVLDEIAVNKHRYCYLFIVSSPPKKIPTL